MTIVTITTIALDPNFEGVPGSVVVGDDVGSTISVMTFSVDTNLTCTLLPCKVTGPQTALCIFVDINCSTASMAGTFLLIISQVTVATLDVISTELQCTSISSEMMGLFGHPGNSTLMNVSQFPVSLAFCNLLGTGCETSNTVLSTLR